MEQNKKHLTLKDFNIIFDPNDNTLLSSKMSDNNGNVNLFRLIIDPNAPLIRQRIGNNERTIF
jgi:hypothetical protein